MKIPKQIDDAWDIHDRLTSLEREVRDLHRLIKFWQGDVPLKYKKAFPQNDEFPYFKAKIKRTTPRICRLSGAGIDPVLEDLEIPSSEQLRKATQRMRKRTALANRELRKKAKSSDAISPPVPSRKRSSFRHR